MSQPLAHTTEAKPSHMQLESSSEEDTELEEGTTASEDDVFSSIQYPAPHLFPNSYLQNWNFINSNAAKKYIKRFFNSEAIHRSLKDYPDHSKNFIYFNTYIHIACFTSLQCHTYQSINSTSQCPPS